MFHQILLLVVLVTCQEAKGQGENESLLYWRRLNDSIQERFDQVEDKINSCSIDKEAMKEEIVSDIKKLLSPLQCLLPNIGQYECNPAQSCREIKDRFPNSTSGYYYVKPTTGPAVRVYCEMTSCNGVSGPWMRVVDFNADNTSHSCPSGLQLFTNTTRRCGMPSYSAGCAPTMSNVRGIPYRKVCGKVIGYQDSSTDAFLATTSRNYGIDDAYVDGVSLTHGHSPRHHIWTFASAVDETGRYRNSICPCTHRSGSTIRVPSFVGSSYFCDTGSRNRFSYGKIYRDNPLWDGAGCGGSSTCCSFNRPPWFMKQLSSSTSDDLELRVCRDETRRSEDVGLKSVELYVQ